MLELWLSVSQWVVGSIEWQNTEKLVTECKYQCALDKLEGLVVACIFELMKMNCSQTGM